MIRMMKNGSVLRKTVLLLATAGLACLMCLALNAQEKETPPAGGPPKPFTIPAHETYTLPNGLKVTLVPYGNIPKATLVLAIRAGNINEPSQIRGIADITGELLKEGTASLSARELAEAAANMGSSLGVQVDEDETTLDMDVLSEDAPAAVKLLADVIEHPKLPESELPRLKATMLRRIAVAKTQPGLLAEARLRKILYGDHPYGEILPAEDDVNRMTIEDARKFYAANFGAGRAHLYVAGKFHSAEMKKGIAAAFVSWPRGSAVVENIPKPKAEHVLQTIDRPGAPQSTIYLGLPVPNATDPNTVPLVVMNALLGGSFGSRITTNIREQKGYTYSPFSQISRRYHDAYWAEVADVTTAHTGDSLKEIFAEIHRLQNAPPSAEELRGIQNYLSGLFLIQNSTRNALIGQLRFVDFQGLPEDYLKTYVQKINAVTPVEVQKLAAQYIKPEKMSIVVVGDSAKIAEQLVPYSSGVAAK